MTMDSLASVSNVRQMAAALQSLGPELSAAAPSGNFAAVLTQVNAEMAALEGGSPPTVTTGATTSELAASGLGTGPGSNVEAASLDGTGTTTATGSLGGAPVSGNPSANPSGGPTGSDVVAGAQKYLGIPYVWGGTDPSAGLDCSGLVQLVYHDLGVDLPRTSEEQVNVGTAVPDLDRAQPGDLVFFGGDGYDGSPSSPGHVGIYIGNGQMIDAPHTGADVRIDPVGSPVAIRRVVPATSSTPAPGPAVTAAAVTAGSSPTGSGAGQMAALGTPSDLQALFAGAGARYGIDPVLLAAVAKQESGFDPGAVSGAGAQGLMQLMPATAAGLGVSALDPASAIDGAAQLLSGYLHDYGGSVPMALAAYNAGPGAVSRYGGVPPYGETQAYVSNITSMLASVGDGAVAA